MHANKKKKKTKKKIQRNFLLHLSGRHELHPENDVDQQFLGPKIFTNGWIIFCGLNLVSLDVGEAMNHEFCSGIVLQTGLYKADWI